MYTHWSLSSDISVFSLFKLRPPGISSQPHPEGKFVPVLHTWYTMLLSKTAFACCRAVPNEKHSVTYSTFSRIVTLVTKRDAEKF